MNRTMALFASATLWATAIAISAPATQAASTTTYYTTVMLQTRPFPSGGAYTGRLHLTVSPDGIVNGWYMPESEGGVLAVTGGKDGDNLWFELGNRGAVRIDATMQEDGRIVGTATEFPAPERQTTAGMPPMYSFVATPNKS
jgi:hypothetical protein